MLERTRYDGPHVVEGSPSRTHTAARKRAVRMMPAIVEARTDRILLGIYHFKMIWFGPVSGQSLFMHPLHAYH